MLLSEGRGYDSFDLSSFRLVLETAFTYNLLHRIIGRYVAEFGLSKSTFDILVLLRNGPSEGMQLHDLGDLLEVSRANVTGQLDILAITVMVKHFVYVADRSARYVSIT